MYCRDHVGLISLAHQAILLLSSVFFVILSRSRNEQLTQLMQLVTNLCRFFELQILRVLHHQPFQFMDFLLQRFRRHIHRHIIRLNNRSRFSSALRFGFGNVLPQRQDIDHFLVQALRRNAVFLVVLLLFLAATFGFANRFRH